MKKILFLLIAILPFYSFGALINMIALEKSVMVDEQSFSTQLKKDWNIELESEGISAEENSMTFKLEGEIIAVMFLDVAIPWKEIKGPCNYSFTWKEAAAEMKKHKGHLIVSLISEKSSLINRKVLLNKVVVSMLNITESIGVYIGRSQLVRSRKEYISEGMRIKANALPIGNWLFFGLAETKKGNAGFTLGLKEFGYREFEILASSKSLGDMYVLFYNTSHYVIDRGIVFRNKETFGYTKTQKLPIRIKKSAVTKDKKVVLIGY